MNNKENLNISPIDEDEELYIPEEYDVFEDDEYYAKPEVAETINYGLPLEEMLVTIGTKEDMLKIKNLIKAKHLTMKDFVIIFSTIVKQTTMNKKYLTSFNDCNLDIHDSSIGVINCDGKDISYIRRLMNCKHVTSEDIALMFNTLRAR